jgi:hypothetical protein
VIFRVLTDKAGDIGTERYNTKMLGASEIERRAHEFCSQALAFKRLRDFCVREDHAIGKTAVGDQDAESLDVSFETMCFFVVDYGNFIEIQVHGSPRFRGFLIPEIAERSRRALIDLLDDAIGV